MIESSSNAPLIDLNHYGLLDTIPFQNVEEAGLDRVFMSTLKNKVYSLHQKVNLAQSKNTLDSCVRTILRYAIYNNYDLYEVINSIIKYKQVKLNHKLDFMKEKTKLFLHSSLLKVKGGGFTPNSVPDNIISRSFFDYFSMDSSIMLA
jgi:hypothetical protein